jgi:AAA ATPase-like protein
LYLADRPGVLVTSEELLDAVWPNVAVTPNTLTKSIVELRVALGDDARTPRCIETVPRRGFRFVATTTADASRAASSPDWSPRAAAAPAFVGREAELRRLHELFVKACAGQRQIAFITGPAGIGKTTLVEAFLDSAALRRVASPVWITRGVCIEQRGAREAYMPVLDALERLAHRPDAERLVGLLRRAAGPRAEIWRPEGLPAPYTCCAPGGGVAAGRLGAFVAGVPRLGMVFWWILHMRKSTGICLRLWAHRRTACHLLEGRRTSVGYGAVQLFRPRWPGMAQKPGERSKKTPIGAR